MRPSLVTVLVPALAVLVTVTPLRAEPGAGPDERIELAGRDAEPIVVRLERGADGLEIEARYRLHAAPATAWDVLTDYEGITRFVHSMRESRVVARGPDFVMVEQSAVGRLFLFRKNLRTRLRVHEEPPRSIRFEDELGRDFDTYRGAWRIEDAGNEIVIVYRLTVRPAFGMPGALARGAFRRAVRELMAEVGVEIERRARLAGVVMRPEE